MKGRIPNSQLGRVSTTSRGATGRVVQSPHPFQGRLKCTGTKADGGPCQAWRANGTEWCYGHGRAVTADEPV